MGGQTPPEPIDDGALITGLHARIIECWRIISVACPDGAMNCHLDELAEMTRCLSQAPARTLAELEIKLAVLCSRLRDEVRPEIRGEVITWMLAESIRHDCRLIAPARSRPTA